MVAYARLPVRAYRLEGWKRVVPRSQGNPTGGKRTPVQTEGDGEKMNAINNYVNRAYNFDIHVMVS